MLQGKSQSGVGNLKQRSTTVVVLWPACVQLVLFVVIGHNSISLVFTVFFLDKGPIRNGEIF